MQNRSTTSHAAGRVFLERIVEATQARIARLKSQHTFESLLRSAKQEARSSFRRALTSTPPAIIAELKKASPSKGVLRPDFDPLRLAASYEAGGAAALSIVTEPEFFQGNDGWISAIRSTTSLPILRKDFVLDHIQIAEAAVLGADAVLLIARLLSTGQMKELRDAAERVSLDVLFEAHDVGDLVKIAECSPTLVGVNARNLDTFAIDPSQFADLRPHLPTHVVSVAESGINSPAQIATVLKMGYSGFLIGESLVTSDDPSAMIRMLRSEASQ